SRNLPSLVRVLLCVAVVSTVVVASIEATFAQTAASSTESQSNTEIAKKIQNPVADLISVPFQSNTNFGFGPENGTQEVLNLQPVVPFHISSDWNVITRTIMPFTWNPAVTPDGDSNFGLGNVVASQFLSPAHSGKWIWGVGPVESPAGFKHGYWLKPLGRGPFRCRSAHRRTVGLWRAHQ